jgi:uncharacterized Tic20 family protein
MSIYDELEKLKKLLDENVITQEEFEREKERLLSPWSNRAGNEWNLGIDERSLALLLHASQFLSAFIIPLILWLLFKDKSKFVDEAGKNILNFELSYGIYVLALCLTCVGIVLVPVVGILMAVFIIIAIIKTLNNETWEYPLSIRFLK